MWRFILPYSDEIPYVVADSALYGEENLMYIKTFRGQNIGEIQRELSTVLAEGDRPTLGIVFGSAVHDLAQLSTLFKQAGIDVFGASTAGEIIADGSAECVYNETIAGLLLTLKKEYYKISLIDSHNKSSYQMGCEAAEWALSMFSHPAVLLVSAGLNADGEQIVRGVVEVSHGQIRLYGGLAGDDLQHMKPVVFTHDALSAQGIVVLALDNDAIDVEGTSASGWQGVGAIKTITKAEGNVVYTIDDQPALDVYKRYLSSFGVNDVQVNAEYPLQVMRPEGYYVLRSVMRVDEASKSLIYAGTVPTGAKTKFSVFPGTEIINAAKEEMAALRQDTSQADFLLLFSCATRQLALGPMVEDEVKYMQQLWDVPLLGFFTYGEIGMNKSGNCDFYNSTCVLVTLKEK
jgi:hypothetical protein